MKVFKYLFITMLIGLFTNIATFAQPERELSEEQNEELKEQLQNYADELNLSEEQKPQFEEISRKYFEELKALKNNFGSRRTKYKKSKSIKKEKKKGMKSLLSESQYNVYESRSKEMEKKMKAKIKEKRG